MENNNNNNNTNNNNNNNKNVSGHGYSSLDHLFGPKDSSSASSSSTFFGSIFPPPSTVHGRDNRRDLGYQLGSGQYEKSDNMYSQSRKGESSGVTSKDSIYQNETVEPSYLSSSIYYGGQENYSPRTRTTESLKNFKKDESEDDPNGNNSNSASRGNWWKGSLYY